MHRRHIVLLVVIVLLLVLPQFKERSVEKTDTPPSDNQRIHTAFEKRQSDLIVTGEGTVMKTLVDDVKGSRHQRFIVKLDNRLTILVAHNIDIAPRISNLERGDLISFRGEYEWNKKGGVIHWTHHDPAGRHDGGWLQHNNRIYQ